MLNVWPTTIFEYAENAKSGFCFFFVSVCVLLSTNQNYNELLANIQMRIKSRRISMPFIRVAVAAC